MIAAAHPGNICRPAFERLEAARKDGDRVAYADACTSIADLRIYEAAHYRIPHRYIDPASGRWEAPETVCRACWEPIDGAVVALGAGGSCLHYHLDCRPHYPDPPIPPLGPLFEDQPHPRRSCYSRLSYYLG